MPLNALRPSLPLLAAVLALGPAPASAQSAPCRYLLAGDAARLPDALRDALQAADCLPAPDRLLRACPADSAPVTPETLRTLVAETQEQFFLGRFPEAAARARDALERLGTGCAPLSAAAADWVAGADAGPVHDLAALALWAALESGDLEPALAAVRAAGSAFPDAAPDASLFPPSLVAEYGRRRPDAAAARATVDLRTSACAWNAAGRIGDGPLSLPAGSVRLGVRCGDAPPVVLEIALQDGEAWAVQEPADADPAPDGLLAAACAPAGGVGLALVESASTWSVAAVREGESLRVAGPDAGESLARFLDAGAETPSIRSPDLEIGLAAALLAAGAALGGGAAAALVDAGNLERAADRAATLDAHARLRDEAADLETAGWALVGLGAAAAAAGLLWLALLPAEEVEPEAPSAGASIHPALGPGGVGLTVVF